MTKFIDFLFACVFGFLGASSFIMAIAHQRGDFMFYAIACSIIAWLMYREYKNEHKSELNNA